MVKERSQLIRSTVKKVKTYSDLREFPKDEPGFLYIRQSTFAQIRRNLHSYEMQTDEFVEHFRRRGVTGHIELIADDEGKSGTLDIHDREGLSRCMRLIEGKELLNGERARWGAAVNVSRFTRDEWLIVPGELMRACYENDVWISTLRMDFNFQDEYCRRVFMLEAEEAARHLKWMKEVLGGGLQIASDKGFYDGRPVAPGYVVDYREFIMEDDKEVKNPTHKKYIVYEPHMKVIIWVFRRYLELNGNFQELCREIERMDYLFPRFETWVSRKSRSKFAYVDSIISDGPYEGSYKITAHGLRGLLTQTAYLGWWIPRNGGLIEEHHPAFIEEGLFCYAHKRLSNYDYAGNRVKPIVKTRHGKAEALLKDIIEGPDSSYDVYPIPRPNGIRYVIRQSTSLSYEEYLSVDRRFIDTAFTEKFFQRLQEWLESGHLNAWSEKEKMREEQVKGSQAERKKQIRNAISRAQAARQGKMDILSDPEIPKTKQMSIDYAKEIAGLEGKIAQLEGDLKSIAEEAKDAPLYEIWELIPTLQQEWKNLPFSKQVMVINAFTRKAVVSLPTPGWLRMEIQWKIGETDIMHQRRFRSNGNDWEGEEEQILRTLYPNADTGTILRSLPERTYSSITTRAIKLGIKREKREKGDLRVTDYWRLAMIDKQYADENGLSVMHKKAQWCTPYTMDMQR